MKKTARIWCPGLDPEMRDVGKQFITALGLDVNLYEGGKGGLDGFDPHAKLWILCHGHDRMPRFVTQKGNWSAEQLATLLAADGLPKDQREIELLVCHAGESVNSRANAQKLLGLQKKATAYTKTGKQIPAALQAKYKKTEAKGQRPQFFETAANGGDLLLPMAAQLSQALKAAGFTHFRLISYKAPVAQYANGKKVYLDLRSKGGAWGKAAELVPQYRAIWH
jgi:hypothetical protein